MRNFKEARQKLAQKLILTAAAGGIAFGGMFGAEKAGAQDGGDKTTPDDSLAQVVPNGAFDEANHIKMIEDPGEVPPLGEEELAVGDSFYLGSIEQEVTVMYADRYMRLLTPDEIGGDPRYYQPIEKIEVNPEYTPEQMRENIWDVYWPQVYFDLIQNGKLTQGGKSYAEALGVQGNVSTETILQALRERDGQWPLIPYRYKWGSNGQEDLYNEGYANPNLPINVIPLPRDLTPPAFGNEPVKPWIRIDAYHGSNAMFPSGAVGVLVEQDGQINLYISIGEDSREAYLAEFLYCAEAVFSENSGIRPIPRDTYEPWYLQWWENQLKGTPAPFLVS